MHCVGYFFRRPRESGDPVAFVQKTLDSLPALAGTKGRGNDDIGDSAALTFVTPTIAFPGEPA
jgi:hypothetical protein